MELKYYLEQLSSSTLKKIIEELGIKEDTVSPNQLVNILNTKLIDKDNLPALYEAMSLEEKEALAYFIIQNPNQYIFYRRLDRINSKISRDKFEAGLIKLRRKGIVFAVRKSWGEIAFIIPENLTHLWHGYFFTEAIGEEFDIDYSTLQIHYPKSQLEEDLFRLLAFVHIEEFPITQKGNINKKDINRMAEILQIDEEVIKHFPITKEVTNVGWPKKVNLLLTIASRLELLSLDSLNTTKKSLKWHQLDLNTQKKYLEAILRLEFRSSDLLIQHLFNLIFHLPRNKWYSFTNLFTKLAGKLNRPVSNELLKRAEGEVLKPLHAFGWVELIEENGGGYYLRLNSEDNIINQIYVQPNYEILVPQSFPHQNRLLLEQFTKLQYQDKMNKYLITKESVIKGLEIGVSIATFINFLKSYSAIPVSDNIIKTLSDWNKNYGKIKFIDVRIMQCDSVKLAQEIKLHKALQPWFIGELSPKNLIIDRTNFNQFVEQLNKLGYYPNKEVWLGYDNKINSADGDDFEEEIELIRDREYQIENLFPNFM